MEEKDIIFVLGGPGSGKGTQAQYIAKAYDIGYLSAGDLLRGAVKIAENPPPDLDEKTLSEYKEINDIIKNGALVPAHVTISLLMGAMQKSPQKHWFIDGFPRDPSQQEEFVEKCKDCVAVLFIEVPDDVLQERLLKRGETSGRVDDNLESIQKRLKTFHEQSVPVLDKYQSSDRVIRIDGNRSIEEVRADCIKRISEIWTDMTPVDSDSKKNEEEKSKKDAEKKEEAAKSKCCLLI